MPQRNYRKKEREKSKNIEEGTNWRIRRIEELVCMNKIIRPAYMSVMKEKDS